MRKWLPIIISTLLFYKIANAQFNFNKFDVSISYADLEQDQRLFEFPQTPGGILDVFGSSHSRDLEFSILLRNKLIDGPNYGVFIGLGYNRNHHRFRRPYDHCAYQKDPFCSLILLTTSNYKKHQLQVPLGLEQNLISLGDARLYLNLNIIPAFNLFYNANGPNLSELRFRFDGFEINPGAGLSFKRFYFQVNYRVLNRRRIDPVIFFDVLFNQTPTPFLEQAFDDYNPEKLQFTLGYQITNPKHK